MGVNELEQKMAECINLCADKKLPNEIPTSEISALKACIDNGLIINLEMLPAGDEKFIIYQSESSVTPAGIYFAQKFALK